MTRLFKVAGLAAMLAASIAIGSPDLRAAQVDSQVREGEAVVTKLSANVSAITYWVSGSDGWHVVTTVDAVVGRAAEADNHAVVRFTSVLLPGQSHVISIPFAVGEHEQGLRIRRLGDRIEVARIPGSA